MQLKALFQVIRWKNLLIGTTTLAFIKFILFPKFLENSSFSNFNFGFYVLSIVCISAGGYIINDIFDVQTDLLNKPEKTIIGTKITKKLGEKLAISFYTMGLCLGIYISLFNSHWYLSMYFFLLAFTLHLYSKKLKSIAFLGNLTVAILISSSILMLSFFENLNFDTLLFRIILAYSLFAFLINLIREIVKDIEDINGDYASGLKTIPIIFGRKRTNLLILILSVLCTVLLVIVLTLNINLSDYLFLYGFLFVLFPLLYFIFKLYSSKTRKQYNQLSSLLKLIMLLGILSIFAL